MSWRPSTHTTDSGPSGPPTSRRWADSLGVGKKADFTILEQDPYAVDPEAIEDIGIWGTVFEGVPYPLKSGPDPGRY